MKKHYYALVNVVLLVKQLGGRDKEINWQILILLDKVEYLLGRDCC